MRLPSIVHLVGATGLFLGAQALAADGHTSGSGLSSASRDSVSIADIQSVATKSGLETKRQQTESGMPYLAVYEPSGQIFAFIGGLGCGADPACQGYSIYSVVREEVIRPPIVRKFNSTYSYTRLAQHEDGLFFEQHNLALGGITDLNIVNGLNIFLQNIKLLGDLRSSQITQTKGPSGDSASASAGESTAPSSFSFAPLVGALPFDAKLIVTGAKAEGLARARVDRDAHSFLTEVPAQ